MDMGRGFGQEILDDPLGKLPGALVLFQDDGNPLPGFYIFAMDASHVCFPVNYVEYSQVGR